MNVLRKALFVMMSLIFCVTYSYAGEDHEVGIFCGASDAIDQEFKNALYELGEKIAQNGFNLVIGKTQTGLMRAVTQGYVNCGERTSYAGEESYNPDEPFDDSCNKFYNDYDYIIIAPGGYRILQEFIYLLSHKKFLTKTKIILLNCDGFWNNLIGQFMSMVDVHALDKKDLDFFTVVVSSDDCIAMIRDIRSATTAHVVQQKFEQRELSLLDYRGRKVGLFCGPEDSNNQNLKSALFELGQKVAENGFNFMVGGKKKGLMKIFVDGCTQGGLLSDDSDNTSDDSEDDLGEHYDDACDSVIIAPGGYGTLNGFLDFLVHNANSHRQKKIIVLNINGFWNNQLEHFKSMARALILDKKQVYYEVASSIDECMSMLCAQRLQEEESL